MKFELVVIKMIYCFQFVSLQQTGPTQCVIVQDKMSIYTPRKGPPSFLSKNNKTECQVDKAEEGMLRCGKSDVYIKPECVCSFYNVYEASIYHTYSSCPHGEQSDVVTQLKCSDCKLYSLNNNGPCINGGKLTCKGNEVAPNVICECPPNYKGMFCEEKMENITRLCERIPNTLSYTLSNCDYTRQDCVTYSRNRKYAFRCKETFTSHERGELSLCIDSEDTTVSLVVTDVPYLIVPEDSRTVEIDISYSTSAAKMHASISVLTMISLTLQL